MQRVKTKKGLRLLLLSVPILLILIPILSGLGAYLYFSRDLPKFVTVEEYLPNTVTKVYSADGTLIDEFYIEKRVLVPLSQIPSHLIKAFLAAEDARFFEHHGVDFRSILRALIADIKAGRIVQGGSTITQQVIKSLFLTPQRDISRKIKEAILAYRIERNLSKEDILYLYLNQIYLGEGAYGVQAASEVYFGKDVGALTLGEAALLAGLPKAPSRYSPYNNLEAALSRRNYVINRMLEEGFISYNEAKKALSEPLRLKPKEVKTLGIAPYFTEYVRKYIEDKYGYDVLYRGGLKVYTTLDVKLQRYAEEAVINGLRDYKKRHSPLMGLKETEGFPLELERSGLEKDTLEQEPTPQAALIALEPTSGEIKAMVGGYNFAKSQFNRAIQARRQPGSAFKPIIYSAAMDRGFTPASIVIDAPIIYEYANYKDGGDKVIWKPKNFDERFYGPITLREALAKSRNVVTVKLLKELGIPYVEGYARRLGIRSPLNHDLSLALGSSALSLLELTSAYSVFAAGGMRFEPIFIKKIVDRNGNVLEENKPTPVQVISPETAYIMTSLLQGVIQDGTGWRARELGRPVAGKTGTTNGYIDAWFIGYTPDLIGGVWVGFDDQTTLGDLETGSKAALPIWLKFMKEAHIDKPIKNFPVPEGVTFVKIDPKTGKIASPWNDNAIFEVFKKEQQPQDDSSEPTSSQSGSFFNIDVDDEERLQSERHLERDSIDYD